MSLGALALLGVPLSARAGDQSPSIRDGAPAPKKPAPAKPLPPAKPTAPATAAPAKPPAPEQAKTAVVDEKVPFEVATLSGIDHETEKAIARLDEACVASPMSREGMTPQEEARCNLAMAQVVSRGKAGASAILVALNDTTASHPYYARSQLYAALGKIDDATVRGVVISGLEKIATNQLADFQSDTWELEETLFAMFGTGPEPAVPWEVAAPVSDPWEETKQAAVAWRQVEAKWAGKKRNEVFITELTRAKKGKTSSDPKEAFVAVSYLVRKAPREAMRAADAYAKRKDLDAAVVEAFEGLSSEADFRVSVPGGRL